MSGRSGGNCGPSIMQEEVEVATEKLFRFHLAKHTQEGGRRKEEGGDLSCSSDNFLKLGERKSPPAEPSSHPHCSFCVPGPKAH